MPCPSAVSVPWVSKQCNGTKIADPSNPRGFRWRPPAATGRHCHSLALVRLWAQYLGTGTVRYRTAVHSSVTRVYLYYDSFTAGKRRKKKLELQL